eukprot:m.59203 g.59203  ORF g.59203 m.59203 type:complete len:293 (-) comp15675_c0_seq5:3545-4423(-)
MKHSFDFGSTYRAIISWEASWGDMASADVDAAPLNETTTQNHDAAFGDDRDNASCADDVLTAKISELSKIVAKLKESPGTTSIGILTLDVLLGLVDEQIHSVVFEMHRAFKLRLLSPADSIPEKEQFRGLVDIAGYDVFGNKTQKTVVEAFNCPHCGLLRQPAKFATHLEKCMGMGGRERRGVSKRIKNTDSGAGTPTLGITSAAPPTSTTTGTAEVKRRASDTPASKPTKAAKMDTSTDQSRTFFCWCAQQCIHLQSKPPEEKGRAEFSGDRDVSTSLGVEFYFVELTDSA